MKIGLIGATGLIGAAALEQLLADPDCSLLRVWARRSHASAHAKLDWTIVDFAGLAQDVGFAGLDAMLCCLGTTTAKAGKAGLETVDRDYVLACGRAARAAGVPRFGVISALGASPRSPAHYSRVKAQMEAGLADLDFSCLEIIRPSLLLGERDEHRPGEALGQKLAPALNALLHGPMKRYRAISGEAVAAELIRRIKAGEAGTHIRYLPAD